MSSSQCTYDICNEGEGGGLAWVETPSESTELEYLERHTFDTAISAEIVVATVGQTRALGANHQVQKSASAKE